MIVAKTFNFHGGRISKFISCLLLMNVSKVDLVQFSNMTLTLLKATQHLKTVV